MKKNQFTFILVGVLFLSTLYTAALALKFSSSARHLQELQATFARMQNTQTFVQQLYLDTMEYSKKDPNVLPLVQALTNASPAVAAPKTPAK